MPTTVEAESREPELLVDLTLPPELTSPARARHALNHLEKRFDEHALYTLRLLVSELVTNSVRHARLGSEQVIGVRVLCGSGTVRVEVLDDGWGFPVPDTGHPTGSWQYLRNRDPEWPGGWGLSIIDAVADSWGIVRNDRTVVWFEMKIDGNRAA